MARTSGARPDLDLSSKVCFYGEAASGKSDLVESLAHRAHPRALLESLGTRTASTNLSYELPRRKAPLLVQHHLELYELSSDRNLVKARGLFAKGAAASVVVARGSDFVEPERFWASTARALNPEVPLFLWDLGSGAGGVETTALAREFRAVLLRAAPGDPEARATALRRLSETVCHRWLDARGQPKPRRRGRR